MLHHRGKHSLHVIDDHMVPPFQEGPSFRRCHQALTRPRGEATLSQTTGLHQIEDVIQQQLRTMLGSTALLQALEIVAIQH